MKQARIACLLSTACSSSMRCKYHTTQTCLDKRVIELLQDELPHGGSRLLLQLVETVVCSPGLQVIADARRRIYLELLQHRVRRFGPGLLAARSHWPKALVKTLCSSLPSLLLK
eukprot:1160963-Pelagomonas_calceolata.AAC.16